MNELARHVLVASVLVAISGPLWAATPRPDPAAPAGSQKTAAAAAEELQAAFELVRRAREGSLTDPVLRRRAAEAKVSVLPTWHVELTVEGRPGARFMKVSTGWLLMAHDILRAHAATAQKAPNCWLAFLNNRLAIARRSTQPIGGRSVLAQAHQGWESFRRQEASCRTLTPGTAGDDPPWTVARDVTHLWLAERGLAELLARDALHHANLQGLLDRDPVTVQGMMDRGIPLWPALPAILFETLRQSAGKAAQNPSADSAKLAELDDRQARFTALLKQLELGLDQAALLNRADPRAVEAARNELQVWRQLQLPARVGDPVTAGGAGAMGATAATAATAVTAANKANGAGAALQAADAKNIK